MVGGSAHRPSALLLFVGAVFVAISFAGVASAACSNITTCACPNAYNCVDAGCCYDDNALSCHRPGPNVTNCQSCCSGHCVSSSSFQSDPHNCGSCGTICRARKSCCKGLCVLTSSFQSNSSNCGTCGTVCESGKSCCKAVCVSENVFNSDKKNCGKCGKACKSREKCHKGRCKHSY